MVVRRLFALLFAVAMSLAPLGMPAMAEAAAPASHHAAMATESHCDQQQQPAQHHKAGDKGCCAAMCIAIAIPAPLAGLPLYHAARERPASDNDRRGFLGEIATPPPKFA